MSRKQNLSMAGGVMLLASAGLAALAHARHEASFLKIAVVSILLGLILVFVSDKTPG